MVLKVLYKLRKHLTECFLSFCTMPGSLGIYKTYRLQSLDLSGLGTNWKLEDTLNMLSLLAVLFLFNITAANFSRGIWTLSEVQWRTTNCLLSFLLRNILPLRSLKSGISYILWLLTVQTAAVFSFFFFFFFKKKSHIYTCWNSECNSCSTGNHMTKVMSHTTNLLVLLMFPIPRISIS